MANSDIESYLRSRLQVLLPSTDVSAGTQADRYVVQPLLSKLGPDPLSTDVRSFILAQLAAEYPDLDTTSAGSQVDEIILGPLQLLLEPLRREIAYVRASQSLSKPDQLSAEETDALLANVFASRQTGGRARGVARVFFADKRTVAVDGTTSVSATGSLSFYCTDSYVLTSDTMALQVEDSRFYIDFEVEAELEGESYNIDRDQLISVSGLPGVVKVVNKERFTGGAPVETSQEAADRAGTAIGERSPNTDNGISSKLLGFFPSIRAIKSIGYGDPEMVRDIIKGTVSLDTSLLGLGPVALVGTAGSTGSVNLATSDTTGPALSYLTILGRTFVVRDTSGVDFTDLSNGDGIYISGVDRTIRDRRSASELWVDDFEIIAKGNRGYTSSGDNCTVSPSDILEHVQTSRFYDGDASFLTHGVQAGDYLRIRGTWTAGGTPATGGNKAAATGGPGNTTEYYLPVVSVAASVLRISGSITDEMFHSGGPADGNGATVNTGAGTITLDGASTKTFEDAPAVLAGDYVSLYEASGYPPQEWEVATAGVTTRVLTLIGGAAPTASSAPFATRWAVRRGPANGGQARSEWPLAACVETHEWAVIRLKAGINPDTYSWLTTGGSSLAYTVRSQVQLSDVEGSVRLTISDVPAGITFPQRAGRTIDVSATDEVHVGGCSDAYIFEPSPTARSVVYSEFHDQEPLASGTDLTAVEDSDVVSAASLESTEVPPYAVLVITEGPNAGCYGILGASSSPGSFRVDTVFSSAFASTSFYITSEATLALDSPKIQRSEGTALVSYFQSKQVDDYSADFGSAGVEAGDTLEVVGGQNEGKYLIESVPSATRLSLSRVMAVNDIDQEYSVYKALTAITRPFRRVTSVELLTAGGAASGLTIPFANPVDVRAGAFSNVGRGGLLSGSDMAVYSPTALWIPTTNALVFNQIMVEVSVGSVVKITEGSNTGTFVVLYIFGPIVYLDSMAPLRESLPSPRIQIVHSGASAAYRLGQPLQVSSVTFGTVEAYNSSTKTLTVLLSGNAPLINATIVQPALDADPSITRTVVSYVADITYEIGPPSIGTARNFFLEPTMFEVRCENHTDTDTALFETSDGRVYVPDYHVNHLFLEAVDTAETRWINDSVQMVPYTALVSSIHFEVGEDLLIDGVLAGVILHEFQETATTGTLLINNISDHGVFGDAITSTGTGDATCGVIAVIDNCLIDVDADFEASGVEVGDEVSPLTIPLTGFRNLAAGANLSGLTLALSVAGAATQTMTFSGTNPIPLDQVTAPYGIIQQIEQFFDDLTAVVHDNGGGVKYVELHSRETLEVMGGTSTGVSGGLIGFSTGDSNVSANSGLSYGLSVAAVLSKYTVTLCRHEVGLPAPSLTDEVGVKYMLSHRGVQRISAKEMAANVDATGLFYFDVELRAVEPGDGGNLADGTELSVSGHRSLGYHLESRNDALTFSQAEVVDFKTTGRIQDPELDDGPDSYVTVMGDSLRINYENDEVVGFAQSILLRDGERVVCNNPVAKAMLPAYVRTALAYSGGEKAVVIKQEFSDLITATQPTKEFQVSQAYDLLSKRGATRVTGPIEILAVRHNVDRSINTVRSRDRLSTGRTAKLIPDANGIKVTRN